MDSELQVYASLLSDIKTRIRAGQMTATRAVNTELVEMYWDIGQLIHKRQQEDGWGAGVIPQLAKDFVNELPEIKGFSERNLKRMLRFYHEYSVPEVTNRSLKRPEEKVPRPVAQLPWGHNAVLIEQVKDLSERFWYAEQTHQQGWSRVTLLQMIKNSTYQL